MISLGLSTITRTKAALPLQPLSGRSGWWNLIREPFLGAWQRNLEIAVDNVLTYYAVYACIRLIATDMGKMCLRLVMQDDDGVWTETTSPAFSPVLRKPNRYQTINKYVESYILSKLIHGNAYVLKQRDRRGIVVALYVLDPARVKPLVAADGSVYYELRRDDLSELPAETVVVPASEIIHDTMIAPFHPLIGLSPLYASGLAATQGLTIQNSSNRFFSNGSYPGGVVMIPGDISDEDIVTLRRMWNTNYSGDNAGNVAFLSNGMTYTPMGLINARDSQMIEQLHTTAEQVCSTFGVPPYLVDIGPPPPYANFEPLLLKYHSQCIQSLATNCEKSHDEGLGLLEKIDGTQYGTEFDINDLIWMDTATRTESALKSITSGGMAPNEARKRFFDLGKVAGGDTPFLQNQMWPLKHLADRPLPSETPPPAPTMPEVEDEDSEMGEDDDALAEKAGGMLGRLLAVEMAA